MDRCSVRRIQNTQVADEMGASYFEVPLDQWNILVILNLDRGRWLLSIADRSEPKQQYDGALLHLLIMNEGPDKIPFEGQVNFIKSHWQEIVSRFDQAHRARTHEELNALRNQRAKRLFGI